VRPADADLAAAGFANAVPAGALAYANGATPARVKLMLALALTLIALLLLGRKPTRQRGIGQA
jgi:hypothetical protein